MCQARSVFLGAESDSGPKEHTARGESMVWEHPHGLIQEALSWKQEAALWNPSRDMGEGKRGPGMTVPQSGHKHSSKSHHSQRGTLDYSKLTGKETEAHQGTFLAQVYTAAEAQSRDSNPGVSDSNVHATMNCL